jgi:dTDP-glucose pyrophosphorylase
MELKALILAGGRGKRLEGVTSGINKCMLPFVGQPLIGLSLENAVRAGVGEIIIVVGYRAEDIINQMGIEYEKIRIKYVIQREQRGLVHAIECARDMINGADFMTFLGDEILVRPKHEAMVNNFYAGDAFVTCGVTRVSNTNEIKKTYAIIQDDASKIFRLIEKPRTPLNDIMGTGNCIFRNEIYDYIPLTPINQKRGEKELPDLIQCAIDDGRLVTSFNIGSGYININTEADIAASIESFQQLMKAEEK